MIYLCLLIRLWGRDTLRQRHLVFIVLLPWPLLACGGTDPVDGRLRFGSTFPEILHGGAHLEAMHVTQTVQEKPLVLKL